jgi:hypothetical protein
MKIETLVFRPPPANRKSNLCAYVELRTPIGRRRAAKKLMQIFSTLTQLVLVRVVHGKDYEFRRNLSTGVITREILITRNTREWAL